jgi:hypothetical protein
MAAEGEDKKDTNPVGGVGGGGGNTLEAAEEAMLQAGGQVTGQELEGEAEESADREGNGGDAGKEDSGCKDLVIVEEDSVLVEDPEEGILASVADSWTHANNLFCSWLIMQETFLCCYLAVTVASCAVRCTKTVEVLSRFCIEIVVAKETG